jgi:hypothetical protein
VHDLRLAVRALLATPAVSFVAALSLALGIGANTAIFSLVNSLLLRALPVKAPQQLAMMTDGTVMSNGTGRRSWTNPIWEQMRSRPNLYDGLFAWSNQRFNLTAGGETLFVEGLWASGGMFDTLGVPAMLGRTFTPADDTRSGGPDGAVAVISYSFWQRQFGGAADAIGALDLERVGFTIRRHRTGLLRPDVGRAFDVAADRQTAGPRQGIVARRAIHLVAHRHGAARRDSPSTPTAAIRGVQPQIREATMPPDWRPSDKDSTEGEVHARPGRHWQLVHAPALPERPLLTPRRRRPGAADRVRQHRQPPARARDGTAPRAERPRRARRLALATGAAVAVRELCARRQRRGGRNAARVVGQPSARAAALDPDHHCVPGSLARLASARAHGRL